MMHPLGRDLSSIIREYAAVSGPGEAANSDRKPVFARVIDNSAELFNFPRARKYTFYV